MKPLEEQDKQLIKASFSYIDRDSGALAKTFYDTLFEFSPFLKPMFKKDRKVQEAHFFMLLASAVDHIDVMDDIAPVLQELGKKHKESGTKPEHFPLVKSALMLALEYELKGRFDDDVKKAWENYYDCIASELKTCL